MSTKHNWEVIKSEYIEGVPSEERGELVYPSLRDLSEKYGVSQSTMRKRSAVEDWPTQRNMYQTKIEQMRREKKAKNLATKSAEFDEEIYKIADIGMKHIQGHFLAAQERFRESRGLEPMTMSSLEQLSRSLERFQRIGRLALGEATEITGGGEHGDQYYIIQEIVNNSEHARRIRENFRQRTGARSSQE